MKRILLLLLTLVLTFSFVACDDALNESESNDVSWNDSGEESSNLGSAAKDPVLVFDAENVKIYYSGITPDLGVGEGLSFLVENSRSESIIVNMSEASYNDVMAAVIQPQAPLHITSSGKKSKQAFVFANQKLDGGTVQFKFLIMDENFKEIVTTDFLEITL